MKYINIRFFIVLIIYIQINCTSQNKQPIPEIISVKKSTSSMDSLQDNSENKPVAADTHPIYQNARFKSVVVENLSAHKYLVTGKAQIFEANLSWIVEDGHNELRKGFATADAGAPEWGNFRFTVDVKKERENSTLTLILFESSAKDGSPQHQLYIPL